MSVLLYAFHRSKLQRLDNVPVQNAALPLSHDDGFDHLPFLRDLGCITHMSVKCDYFPVNVHIRPRKRNSLHSFADQVNSAHCRKPAQMHRKVNPSEGSRLRRDGSGFATPLLMISTGMARERLVRRVRIVVMRVGRGFMVGQLLLVVVVVVVVGMCGWGWGKLLVFWWKCWCKVRG